MYTKSQIEKIVKVGNGDLGVLLRQQTTSRGILSILENLGYLPADFDARPLLELVENANPKVRTLAVKNLAKLGKVEFLDVYWTAFRKESDTTTRREIVSAIGRLRKAQNKPYLFQTLEDEDPKIVCQAIRGLLFYDKDDSVSRRLKPLMDHPNEMVRNVIHKEFFANKSAKTSTTPHSESPDRLKNVVVNGDVRDVIKYVDDESIHLTFTSPPYYNARDYSIYQSYNHYLDFLEEVFREVHRITKEGRFFVLNTSPIIIPRVSRSHSSKRYPIPFDIHPRLTQIGWEFIDDIIWVKPEYSVKNRIGGFMQHRKPLGYKPNTLTEYVMVYRKQTSRLLDWNIRSYSEQTVAASRVNGEYESTNVWKIDPKFDKGHSAVFPVELCDRVIRYYSYKGDLVFDPFGGSGTVGRTAKMLGRSFFLTEKDPDYFKYMQTKVRNRPLSDEDIRSRFLSIEEFIEEKNQ